VTGGHIGLVRASWHKSEGQITFTDVQVDALEIQNGEGTKPGHYVFTDTGLACENVVWDRVVEGTTVTIDGVPCLAP
jgi:hypothetical protein